MTPSEPRPSAVLFDLDGTLVDSFEGIADAYHHVRRELGLSVLTDEDLRPLIGPPIQVGLRRHFGLTGDRLDEGIRVFRERYGAHGALKYIKYPGIDSLLRSLHTSEFRLCIATSKLRTMAETIVDNAGWSELIDRVDGAEPDDSRFLKQDVMKWTLDHLPDGRNAVAMVGDRAEDMVASRQLGVHAVGVTWGYGTPTELNSAGATETVDSPEELLALLLGRR